MMKMARILLILVACGCLAGLIGCSPMHGGPSLTLISRDLNTKSPNIKVLGPRDEESDTFTWCLVFLMFGQMIGSHEATADRLLDKYNADLLLDTEMTVSTYGIPYIFMRGYVTTSGVPAKFVTGGAQ